MSEIKQIKRLSPPHASTEISVKQKNVSGEIYIATKDYYRYVDELTDAVNTLIDNQVAINNEINSIKQRLDDGGL